MAPITYVTIAGNIGTGKTTTVSQICSMVSDVSSFYEERDVYLSRFYSNPERFAFLNQLAYSLQYLRQSALISKINGFVVQDRSIYDTHEVFSAMRHEEGLIEDEEYSMLGRIYDVSKLIIQPSVMVVLDAEIETTYQRFQKRSHELEKGLTRELLERLRERYLRWYSTFNLCPKLLIQTDSLTPDKVANAILTFVEKQNQPALRK